MGIRLTFKPRAVCSLGESPLASACSIALALRACALSMLPTLCHLWLRWSATPVPGAMGNPSGDLIPEARFVHICAQRITNEGSRRIRMRYSTGVGGGGATGSGSVARTCLPGRGAGGDGSPQDGTTRRPRRIEHWGIRQKKRAIHVCVSDQLDPVPVSLSRPEPQAATSTGT